MRFRLFADDCVVYLPIESADDQEVLSKYLIVLSKWCTDWKMRLNTTKCRQMTITRKKYPLQYAYKINNVELEVVNEYKYLGVTITSNFTWNKHIQNITSSAMRRLWLLRHRLQHCTSRTKTVAYATLVRPLLEYADVGWDPHTKTDSAMLERVQKKALRFIHNAYSRRTSVTELRRRSDLPTLESHRKIHRLKLSHSIVNGYSKLDFNSYLEFNTSRPTRNKYNKTIVMPFTRTNAHRLSFFPRTIADWNTLPHDVTNITSQNAFVMAIQNGVWLEWLFFFSIGADPSVHCYVFTSMYSYDTFSALCSSFNRYSVFQLLHGNVSIIIFFLFGLCAPCPLLVLVLY